LIWLVNFGCLIDAAKVACAALWADHAFDPIRDKFPLGEDGKPTFAMLTYSPRIDLVALAIKTIEKCRALQADAIALLPNQTQQRFEGFYRETDSLNAQLCIGNITRISHARGREPAWSNPAWSAAGIPPMHIICALPNYRRSAGNDEFTVPLCKGHHRELHRCGDEAAWWSKTGIDPTTAARVLWLKTHPLRSTTLS
jgi:hypothetical protein